MRNRSTRSSSFSDKRTKPWLIFFSGLIVGLLIAVVVAIYITHAPVPTLTKSVRSTERSELDKPKYNETDNDQANALTTADANAVLHATDTTEDTDNLPQSIEALAQRETPKLPTTPQSNVAPAAGQTVNYVLQIGAYTTVEEAERQKAKLAMQGYEATISPYEVNKVQYYRLRVGPFNNIRDAEQMKSKLASEKINSLLIKTEN